MRGRVVRAAGAKFLVEAEGALYQCAVRGRLKVGARRSTSPLSVGDWVGITPQGGESGVVEGVYPRRSKISRAGGGMRPCEKVVAANMDQLVIVVAARRPALRPGFIDRALVVALKGNVDPIVCFNKMDLDPQRQIASSTRLYAGLGYRVYCTSAVSGEGIEGFKTALQGRDSTLWGQSGVGKSSLLNRIEPGLGAKTRQLMKKHDRGSHTTAAVQLYRLQMGGCVVDTPGIKGLKIWDLAPGSLIDYFAEMAPLSGRCQFRDCSHIHEPGCAIRAGVQQGRIAAVRYQGYAHIMKSLQA